MTIQELFSTMNSEEIARFCDNVSKTRDIVSFFTNEHKSPREWIASAFVWEDTKQGHDYWQYIVYKTNELSKNYWESVALGK